MERIREMSTLREEIPISLSNMDKQYVNEAYLIDLIRQYCDITLKENPGCRIENLSVRVNFDFFNLNTTYSLYFEDITGATEKKYAIHTILQNVSVTVINQNISEPKMVVYTTLSK